MTFIPSIFCCNIHFVSSQCLSPGISVHKYSEHSDIECWLNIFQEGESRRLFCIVCRYKKTFFFKYFEIDQAKRHSQVCKWIIYTAFHIISLPSHSWELFRSRHRKRLACQRETLTKAHSTWGLSGSFENLQNQDQASTSKSQQNISISTKLQLQNLDQASCSNSEKKTSGFMAIPQL